MPGGVRHIFQPGQEGLENKYELCSRHKIRLEKLKQVGYFLFYFFRYSYWCLVHLPLKTYKYVMIMTFRPRFFNVIFVRQITGVLQQKNRKLFVFQRRNNAYSTNLNSWQLLVPLQVLRGHHFGDSYSEPQQAFDETGSNEMRNRKRGRKNQNSVIPIPLFLLIY